MIVVIASLLSFVESIKVFGAGFFKTADLFFVPRTDVGPALRLADFVDIKVGKALIVADLVGEAVGSFVGTAIVGVLVGVGSFVGRGVGDGVGVAVGAGPLFRFPFVPSAKSCNCPEPSGDLPIAISSPGSVMDSH